LRDLEPLDGRYKRASAQNPSSGILTLKRGKNQIFNRGVVISRKYSPWSALLSKNLEREREKRSGKGILHGERGEAKTIVPGATGVSIKKIVKARRRGPDVRGR